MVLSLHCPCGKTMAVDDQHRGKKVRCPACGKPLTVEISVPAEPIQAPQGQTTPAPSAPSALEVDLGTAVTPDAPTRRPTVSDEDSDMPEVRKPLRRPSEARRSTVPWYVLGGFVLLAVVLILVCGGLGTLLFRSRASAGVRGSDHHRAGSLSVPLPGHARSGNALQERLRKDGHESSHCSFRDPGG